MNNVKGVVNVKKWLLAIGFVFLAAIGLVACSGGSSAGGDNFKVGMAFTGSKTDGGWCQTAYEGLMKIKSQLGAEVIFNENTQPSDYEKILRDYAKEDCQVVIGHGYEFTDGAKIVAEEFPNVKFIVTSTDIGNGKNLGSIQNSYQSGFLQGIFAANMSDVGVVAGVGGQEIPPIKNDILGYDAGAKYAKADVQVLTAMTGSFDDANKLKEQSLSLINQGADIVMVDADHAGRGGYEAAKEKGHYAIGSIAPEYDAYKDSLIACANIDMATAILQTVELVKEGKFEGKNYLKGVEDGIVTFTYNPALEDKVKPVAKEAVEKAVKEIKDGKLDVMKYIKL
ncbi:hypothetical protein AZF37_08155 [endosymbiont 'TC1' of Trimyema compressum]|nr:hypothetical protein AZF37_08155 [endosymbiont 'TC1' of Trimyema compressum]